jgi:hypothetical protein
MYSVANDSLAKYQLFKRLEESLTCLDQSSLEKKHADVLNRLDITESEVTRLKRKEKKIEET